LCDRIAETSSRLSSLRRSTRRTNSRNLYQDSSWSACWDLHHLGHRVYPSVTKILNCIYQYSTVVRNSRYGTRREGRRGKLVIVNRLWGDKAVGIGLIWSMGSTVDHGRHLPRRIASVHDWRLVVVRYDLQIRGAGYFAALLGLDNTETNGSQDDHQH